MAKRPSREHRLDNLLAVGVLGGRLGFMAPRTLPPQRLIDFMEICIWAKDSRMNTLLGVVF